MLVQELSGNQRKGFSFSAIGTMITRAGSTVADIQAITDQTRKQTNALLRLGQDGRYPAWG